MSEGESKTAGADNRVSLTWIAQLVALSSALGVVYAIAYNFGFFQAVGLTWITKLSIQDHVSTLPKTIVPLAAIPVGAVVGHLILNRKVGNQAARPEPAKGNIGWIFFWIGVAIFLLPWLISLFGFPFEKVILAPLGGDRSILVFLGFLFYWTGFLVLLVGKYKKLPRLFVDLLFWIPWMMALTVLNGYQSGQDLLRSNIETLTVELEGGRYLANLTPIYVLSAGILAQDRDCECIIYIPESKIIQFMIRESEARPSN